MPDITPPDIDPSQPQTDQTQVPGQALPQAGSPPPGMGSKLLGVLSGGLHDSSYQVDPNTGQMTQVQNPNPNKPGQMFKNMLSGMLSGLAGAGNAQAAGHKGFGSGLAAGIEQNDQRLRQVDNQKRETAQQGFDDQQKIIQNKANFIKSQDEHAISAFNLAKGQSEITEKEAADTANLEHVVTTTPGASYKAFAKDFPSLVQQMNDPKERQQLMQWRAKGELVQHPVTSIENGVPKVIGVDFYHIPTAYMDKPTDKDVSYSHEVVDPKTGESTFKTETIPAGTLSNRDAISINSKPLTGAITPAVKYEEAGKEKTQQFEMGMKDKEMANQWKMMGARFNQEVDMAKQKGEIQTPASLKAAAQTIAEYGGDINTLRFLMKTHPEFEGMVKEINPEWDQRIFTSSQHAMNDYMGGGKTFQAIRAGDTGIQHMSSLRDLVSKLPETTNITQLNRAISTLARQTGNPDVSDADTLNEALATERARALHGGVPDKASVEEARKVMSLDKGPRALTAAIDSAAHIQAQALGSYAGDFQRDVPGASKMAYAPNLSQGAEQALAKMGIDNPFNYGEGPKPLPGGNKSISTAPRYVMDNFMKIAGGDTNKAWALAQKRGWGN